MDFLQTCGIFGLAIIAVSIIPLALGVLLLVVARGRKPLALLLPACLLPLLLGLLGTAAGRAEVRDAVEVGGDVGTPAMLADGLHLAWNTTWLGGGASLFLLVFTTALLLVKGQHGHRLPRAVGDRI